MATLSDIRNPWTFHNKIAYCAGQEQCFAPSSLGAVKSQPLKKLMLTAPSCFPFEKLFPIMALKLESSVRKR